MCLPGEIFVHHGRSGPVGWGIGDGASDEMGRDGGCCIHQFVSGFVAWYVLMTWDPDEGGGAFPVA